MTAPTAPALGPSAPSVAPETLLDGTNRTSDVTVMKWLIRARHADLAHPGVRRWVVPLLCAGIGIPAARDAANGIGPAVPTVLALIVAFCVPLLWRQQRPVLVFALTSAVSSVALALDAATGSEAARIVALLNVGRNVRPAQLAVCLAIAVAQTSLSVVVRGAEQPNEQFLQTPVLAIVQSALVAAVAAAGLVGRVVNAYIRALHERAVRLEVERDQRARLAAAAERARVAREMHDILGHTLAVIVGLAGGAAGLTETKPKRGAETLRIIADTGRGALAELRRLLAVIGEERDTSEDPPTPGTGHPHAGPPLAPQPGLADLDPLLERVRGAGPTVTLHTQGALTDLAPGLQLAVYRVVQESLTNTLKHAAATTTVHITLTTHDTSVHVTVEDTGPSRAPRSPAPHVEGRGLLGMRERAALYGGSVTAGPTPQGGWTVEAHFRITTTPPPPHTAPTEKRPA
ncbi:sensor histidine kinase [Streptomyces sp. IB201691-2A2]|uniref:sensor histidine kinase n=1 Tax=Streptomyces sp. IB201691-2A2 TaxID=2561920 RepID=UPI0011800CDF|nr:sensor histidine kinase [Streptomyces sp. IB201691-2A2]TRO69244.1 two-component sensor histidine kinase [Streptomyces sp. IB201691-2A2]